MDNMAIHKADCLIPLFNLSKFLLEKLYAMRGIIPRYNPIERNSGTCTILKAIPKPATTLYLHIQLKNYLKEGL